MAGEILDGETGDLLVETAAPEAPAWSGQPLEVFHVAPDVLFHEPGAGTQHYLMADGDTVRDLEAMR